MVKNVMRFHMWKPIWYYKKYKVPEDPWKKARWMGSGHNSGDAMTYYIKTEESHSFLHPELKDIELDFLNKGNEIIKDDTIVEAEEK
eukprot:10407433-Ditylum_brightwellii.AAC.1